MSHMPFILASYLITMVVLVWAAFTPAMQRRKLLKQLEQRQAHMEDKQ